MCAGMIDLKKAMIKISELEEELKSTCDGYEEGMTILVEKNDDLMRKLGVFMGDPARGGDDDHSKDIRSEDYIIIDDCRCQNRRISGRGSRTVHQGILLLDQLSELRWEGKSIACLGGI